MMSSWLRYALLSVVLMLGGCMSLDTTTMLRIEPADNINPDSGDRASPVVVRVYELASSGTFESSDFFSLYDNAEEELGKDLLGVEDMVVRPAERHHHLMRLDDETRYIGIMVAFRDIENAHWRLVVKANPNRFETVRIGIDELSVRRVGR